MRKRHGAFRSSTLAALALSAFLLGMESRAGAQTVQTVSGGGREMFEVHFLDAGDNTGAFEPDTDDDGKVTEVPYTLDSYIKSGVAHGVQYWAGIMGPGAKNTAPLPVYVHGQLKLQNASAGQVNIKDGSLMDTDYFDDAIRTGFVLANYDPTAFTLDEKNQKVYYNGKLADKYGLANLTVGDNFGAIRPDESGERGWHTGKLSVVLDNEQAADLDGTFRHELGHALGIMSATDSVEDEDGEDAKDDDGLLLYKFSTAKGTQPSPTSFFAHLVDENLNPALPGMEIITPREFSRRNELAGGTLKESDYFIMTNVAADKWKDGSRTGKAYFVGKHVTEVLDGMTFDGVSGLRINGWEYDGDGTRPELSHIQSGGMMAHASYSNYAAFMEVELAVMQDIGYTIDRKKWFGRSVYADGRTLTNTQGYFERNSAGTAYLEGTPSTAPLGIGLHVYGSNNTITQAADLLADGAGAAGVRVDGQNNTLTLDAASKITANGDNGTGVLFAYGRNHVFNQKGTVEATGDDGIAVQYNFGSSTNGAMDEYRGSYIRYRRGVDEDTGAINEAENLKLSETPELNGPLISSYNLSGSVTGSKYAIFIGRNAFVKDINVLSGASISGGIKNDWKHFSTDGSYDAPEVEQKGNPFTEEELAALPEEIREEVANADYGNSAEPLVIQYGGNIYPYAMYIPDLVTNLNFKTDLSYDGNIDGADNTRLNVKSGMLTYGGKASVTTVEVSKGATLKGGTYTLSDQTANLAGGMTDDKTGKFINHGTLVPKGADLKITGTAGTEQLVSDGTFAIALKNGSTAYKIAASGLSAVVSGSTVAPVAGSPYKTQTKYTFLTADGISGSFGQSAGDSFSDFYKLSELDHDGAAAWLILDEDDSAAQTDGEKAVLSALRSSDSAAATAVLSLNGGAGQKALAAAAKNPAADAAALTLRGDRIAKAVRTRSGWLNDVDPDATRKTHYWYKAEKDWNRYGSGAIKGSGYGFTLGADWNTGKNWIVGLLGQYGHDSWNIGEYSWTKAKIKDWRFGIYGVNRSGANELTLHAAFGRQRHENDKTVLGLPAKGTYHSSTQELGVRFSRDLTQGKTWSNKPFAQLQIVRYHQDAFDETGSAPWAMHSDSFTRLYSAGTVGWSVERSMKDGRFGFSLGYKRVFSGDDPAVWTHVIGQNQRWRAHSRSFDRNLLVASATGEWTLSKHWSASFGMELEQGRHDRNLSAKASFCLSW